MIYAAAEQATQCCITMEKIMGAGASKPAGFHVGGHAGPYKCDMTKMMGCGEQHDQWKAKKRDWEGRCVAGAVDEYNAGNGVIGGGANVIKHLAQNGGCKGMQLPGKQNQ